MADDVVDAVIMCGAYFEIESTRAECSLVDGHKGQHVSYCLVPDFAWPDRSAGQLVWDGPGD